MLRKTKVEIIDETVAFYGADPKGRRSMNKSGTCLYIGFHNTHCAFARCCTDEGLESLARLEFNLVSDFRDIDGIVKPEYAGHSKAFWREIQMLHDNDIYWDDKGISFDGAQWVESLKSTYA